MIDYSAVLDYWFGDQKDDLQQNVLHRVEVTPQYRLDQITSDSRPRKDGFSQHRSAEQRPES